MYAPGGTRVEYTAQVAESDVLWYGGSTDLLSALASDLQNVWHIVVEKTNLNSGLFERNITLGLLSQDGHGNGTDGLDDIRRIVDGSFYKILGHVPQGSRITKYTLPASVPGGGTEQDTGAPPAPKPQPDNPDLSKLDLPNFSTLAWAGLVGLLGLGALLVFLKA